MSLSRPTIAALALLIAAPAFAQQAPGLGYSQPLTPAAVTQVQEKLRAAGTYQGRADGVWGPDSQQALERFQQARGLQVTGQMNQATAATLGVDPAVLLGGRAASAAAAAPADPDGPEVVRGVQRRLRALGFYRGQADGLWGAGTQAALERFQQGRGLQANGQINPATLEALNLDATGRPTARSSR